MPRRLFDCYMSHGANYARRGSGRCMSAKCRSKKGGVRHQSPDKSMEGNKNDSIETDSRHGHYMCRDCCHDFDKYMREWQGKARKWWDVYRSHKLWSRLDEVDDRIDMVAARQSASKDAACDKKVTQRASEKATSNGSISDTDSESEVDYFYAMYLMEMREMAKKRRAKRSKITPTPNRSDGGHDLRASGRLSRSRSRSRSRVQASLGLSDSHYDPFDDSDIRRVQSSLGLSDDDFDPFDDSNISKIKASLDCSDAAEGESYEEERRAHKKEINEAPLTSSQIEQLSSTMRVLRGSDLQRALNIIREDAKIVKEPSNIGKLKLDSLPGKTQAKLFKKMVTDRRLAPFADVLARSYQELSGEGSDRGNGGKQNKTSVEGESSNGTSSSSSTSVTTSSSSSSASAASAPSSSTQAVLRKNNTYWVRCDMCRKKFTRDSKSLAKFNCEHESCEDCSKRHTMCCMCGAVSFYMMESIQNGRYL